MNTLNDLLRFAATPAIAFALTAAPVLAQEYPNKPVRIIMPFPAGTGPDANAREIAAKLTPLLGQPVLVENRPGAAGAIGTEAAAKAAPDGYTLYIGTTSTISIAPFLYSKLPYNAERDFVPISMVGALQTGLVVNAAVPARSVRELLALVKSKPESINAATQGIGTYSHLAGEWFGFAAATPLKFIPYNTSSPYNDLLAGQVQLMFDALPVAIGNIRAGKLRLLALTGKTRHPALPDAPTFAEAGLGDYAPVAWQGLFAPAGTLKPIVDKLGAAMAVAGKSPDLVEKWRAYGGDLMGSSPAEFAAFLKVDQARWSGVIKRAGVRLD